ncbi:MAG: protein FlhF [Desulfobacterales bacterium]|nr:protein FlhF [Desulfobacterales bacterium]
MELKEYQAGSIQEALNLVRRDLGSDALILSTRKLRGAKSASGGSARSGQELFEISAVAGGIHTDSGSNHFDPSSLNSLKSELMSLREMIFLLSRSAHLMEGFRINPEAIDLYARLIRSGIAEPYAQLFLEKGGAFKANEQTASNNVYERVLKEIMKVVDVSEPFDQSEERVVAAFVGPTGVGKTTTIAKLAAELSLKQKKTIGLISIDNYRIGAIEQLKTYAGILDVPCFPAFNNDDLQFALKQMKEKDVILIDTAGQSHYDMARMEEMEKLIGRDRSINTHLLLSTVTSELEMGHVARNFGQLNFSAYIFTKTDETRARGVIINQLLKLRMPISFITTGQRVPEDISKATRTGILRLIFE